MIINSYLDESGTHGQSPISVMAGYAGTAEQWEHFAVDWATLVRRAGVRYIHAVELFKQTKQFRGWKAPDVNALAVSIDDVIASHLQLGFAVVIRSDDYKAIYAAHPRPRRLDSKYGLCFRACLNFVPSFLASAYSLAGPKDLVKETVINFVLEDGHANAGDVRRLFDLYKSDILPDWAHWVGNLDISSEHSPGLQAADFLAYTVYRAELLEHGDAPTAIENSSYIAGTELVANMYPRPTAPQRGPLLYRIPNTRQVLQALRDDHFATQAGEAVRR
jgi:Protein of unknown function (DUF3800)